MATVDVDTRVDGDDLVVESEFNFVGLPSRVTYDANVQVGGTTKTLRAEDVVEVAAGTVSSTTRFSLADLGLAPGDVEDVNVTVIYIREATVGSSEELAQDQFTIAVQRPPDDTGGGSPPPDGGDNGTSAPSLSDLSMTCLGVSPSNPRPGQDIVISLDTSYSGGVSFPTVRFRPTVGGVGVGEVEEQIGSSTQLSLGAVVPNTLSPGDTVEVNVEAIDIEK